MRDLERRLLKEIKNQFSLPISEDIQDYTFAIIQPELPKPEHREYETFLHVYGEKQATMRGRAGVRTVEKDMWINPATKERTPVTHSNEQLGDKGWEKIAVKQEKCPMCDDSENISVGDAIAYHIQQLNNEIEGIGGLTDFNYKEGLRNIAAQAGGKKKQNLETTITTLESDKDYLADALKRYRESGKAEEVVQCPVCTGWQWVDIPQYLHPTTGKYDKGRAEKHQQPWEIFIDWLWKTLEDAGLSPVQGSGFTGEKDRYGKTAPTPKGKAPIGPHKDIIIITESLGTTPLEVHKNLIKIFSKSTPPFFQIQPFPDEEMKDRFDMAVATSMDKMGKGQSKQIDRMEEWIEENRSFYVTTRVKESRYGEELGLPPYEITTPLDMEKLLGKLKGESLPISVGEVPPREGEWWDYGASIKEPGAELRKKRSKKAHVTHLGMRDIVRGYIEKGEGLEQIKERLITRMRESAAKKGRTVSGEMVERYKNTIDKAYGEIEGELKNLEAALAASEYPESKYTYWDKKIEELAKAMGRDVVTVELAVSKYMDTLDEFPQPFDFDRLSVDASVRALNTLISISPDEIDSLMSEAAEYLKDLSLTQLAIVEEVAKTVISDLGCTRANAIYSALREIRENKLKPMLANPLYRESSEFSREYNKAAGMFELLLGCSIPITKVSNVVPIVEDKAVFNPNNREFWSNILEDHTEIDPLVSVNSRRLASFYREKINGKLLESLKKMYKNHRGPATMARVLDSSVSGRNAGL